jgi:hypothetical protein
MSRRCQLHGVEAYRRQVEAVCFVAITAGALLFIAMGAFALGYACHKPARPPVSPEAVAALLWGYLSRYMPPPPP